jgi:hypothetical protein
MIDKATPGPYKVTSDHRSAAYAIDAPQRKRAGGTNRICSVRPASRRPDAYDEAEANALLLASSWETAAALKRVTAERDALELALDQAWLRINSLCGYVHPDDDVGQGRSAMIDEALFIIEDLGGMDPARRPTIEGYA